MVCAGESIEGICLSSVEMSAAVVVSSGVDGCASFEKLESDMTENVSRGSRREKRERPFKTLYGDRVVRGGDGMGRSVHKAPRFSPFIWYG